MQKLISWAVKIAGLVITSPVTWYVAGSVFGDIQPVALRVVVQLSALVVVEGVFLASWLALDASKAAPDAVRARHAISAAVMYLGLWLLALVHGEGIAGLVFRAALGLALAGSIFDSGVMASIRLDNAVDRDVAKDRRVRKHARALARQVAIAQLDAGAAIDLQRIALSRQRGLTAVKSENRALTAQNSGPLNFPIDRARAIRDDRRAARKDRTLPRLETLIAAGATITDAAAAVGIARQTASKWMQEIATAPRTGAQTVPVVPRNEAAPDGNGNAPYRGTSGTGSASERGNGQH